MRGKLLLLVVLLGLEALALGDPVVETISSSDILLAELAAVLVLALLVAHDSPAAGVVPASGAAAAVAGCVAPV